MTSARQRRRLPDITEAMTITHPLAAGIDVGITGLSIIRVRVAGERDPAQLAILYYHLLKYGPAFVEEGQRRLAQNSEGRKRRKLNRLAAELGVEIVEKPRAA